jgi:hypothetical protein
MKQEQKFGATFGTMLELTSVFKEASRKVKIISLFNKAG